ncbi:MAG: alpha/beta hydrolase [Thermoleophilaceae bacterium]|nr:alpha/beta hydrolase [Thermoleophilaceae bacterium]
MGKTLAMRRLLLLLAGAALLAGCTLPAPPGAAPLRYRDVVFSSATKTADVQYGTAPDLQGNQVALRFDVYRPAGDTVARRPAIIWVHGGGFSGGNKGDGTDWASAFARRGYVAVSLGYRLLATGPCGGTGPVPEYCYTAAEAAQHDAQAAVRYLRRNADTLGVDPERIAMAGESAGAVTSLLVGWRRDDPGTSGNPGYPSDIRAAVSVAGGLPVNDYIGPGDSPAFFFHGDADTTVPFSWATSNVNAMAQDHLVVGIHPYSGAGHNLFNSYRNEIHQQSSYFLYFMMDLEHASR